MLLVVLRRCIRRQANGHVEVALKTLLQQNADIQAKTAREIRRSTQRRATSPCLLRVRRGVCTDERKA